MIQELGRLQSCRPPGWAPLQRSVAPSASQPRSARAPNAHTHERQHRMGKLFQRAAAWLAGRFCGSAMIAMSAVVAMIADNLPVTDGWHGHPGP